MNNAINAPDNHFPHYDLLFKWKFIYPRAIHMAIAAANRT